MRRLGVSAITAGFLLALFGTSGWFVVPTTIMGFFLSLRAFRTFFPNSAAQNRRLLVAEVSRLRETRAREALRQQEAQRQALRRERRERSQDTFWTTLDEALQKVRAFLNGTPERPRREPPAPKQGGTTPVVTPPPMRIDPAAAEDPGSRRKSEGPSRERKARS